MSNTAPITIEQLFRFWRALPHQQAAIGELEADLRENGYAVAMKRDRPWFSTWSQAGKQEDPKPAVSAEQQQRAALAPLLAIIRAGEGNYDSINRGRAGDTPGGRPGLSGMTLAKVMELQASGGAFAVGAYQFIPETLKIAARAAGIGGTTVFNDATQDRLAIALLLGGKRPALRDYLTGKTNDLDAAQIDLAKEWASIPQPNGRGFYDGDSAGNRATAKAGAVREALQTARRQLAAPAGRLPKLELPAQQPGRVTPSSPFETRLTAHIQVGEFALFQEARRFHHQHQVDTAAELAAFLERVRSAFGGKPVIITSGYRPPAVNRSVGGASGSEHLYDAPGVGAVDFWIKDTDINAVQAWCDREWPFSLGYGAPQFVHLGIRKGRPRVRWDYQ